MAYDVIIIGAGSMGMSASYYLAKRGARVLMIDRYDPPHSEGAHHGDTRLIRHAYGEGSSYVPMALRAQELWEELNEISDKNIFHKTGVLNVGTENSSFLKNVAQSAESYNLRLEKLTHSQVNDRWPGFALHENLMGYFEPDSGVLMSENIIESYKKLAMEYEIDYLPNTEVQSICSDEEGIRITFNDMEVNASKLIISAGKGTNKVLSLLNEQLPLTTVRKTFSWFETNEAIYQSSEFPGWAYDNGNQTYYGFPSIEGKGLKIGRHDKGEVVEDADNLEEFGTFESDQDDVETIQSHLLSQSHELTEGKVCTYTNTPDGDFIIDHLPGRENIIVACGFSGHGFKFSSVIGEILSEIVLDEKTKLDIVPFRIDRFE
ncbi:N-methyl-L-tryptophan oxidase [Halalkalibacillus sediminis]|uniref:N-methyl-L-tryptophan oxidase n=1 Tax=Halalkalibacillus sediminis TaxID=2018042 RepID=A0A2I0QUA5_9BACI|nr:N-methyl-L-tryptophan oxidase [Halalkalibacillus sediminis]PKR77906.1 N-methyl-L-tryptophan oxidase [Halalkalibacillus sediminis]